MRIAFGFLVISCLVIAYEKPSLDKLTQDFIQLQKENLSRINKLDHQIEEKVINKSQEVSHEKQKDKEFIQDLANLRKLRIEYILREKLFEALLQKIRANYSQWNPQSITSLSEFLQKQLQKMAIQEVGAFQNELIKFEDNYILFLTYAAQVMGAQARSELEAFQQLKNYIEYSSIRQPKLPADYLKLQNYTNATVSESVEPKSYDELSRDKNLQEKLMKLDQKEKKIPVGTSKTGIAPDKTK